MNRLQKLSAGVSLLLALTATAAAADDLPAPTAAVEEAVLDPNVHTETAIAIDADQRMTVPVMLGGQGPYNFVIDTGADRTAITSELATKLGLKTGKPVMLHAANGAERRDTAVAENLKIGQRTVRRVEAPLLFRADIGADGMLGIDTLKGQQIVMDFKAKKMSVEPAKREFIDSTAVIVPGRSFYGQLILVDITIRGVPVYVILDSGSESSVANEALARRLVKGDENGQPIIEILDAAGITANAKGAVIPEIAMGNGIRITNLPVVFTDLKIFERFKLKDRPAMLLGMDVLRKFDRVAVDFQRKQARFNLAAQ
jgi:predicted aspartyl protease